MSRTLSLVLITVLGLFVTRHLVMSKRVAVTTATPGCILLAAQDDPTKVPKGDTTPRVFLINKKGKVVHQWITERPPFSAKLDKLGRLWVLEGLSSGSADSTIAMFDENKQLERFEIPFAHHDFDFIDDHQLLVSLRTKYGKPLPKTYSEIPGDWKVDFLGVYDTIKRGIVREIDLQSVVDLNVHPGALKAATSVNQVNSVAYSQTNPWTQKPSLLISARFPSRVAVLDFANGKILWQSPKGLLHYQHDARWLSNGDLLIFNNGWNEAATSVIQYNPLTEQTTWRYRSRLNEDFFNHYQGGAQRLANGNTLITWGSNGYLFEVDPEGNIVWRWFNDLVPTDPKSAWPYAAIFKAQHYSPDQAEVARWAAKCQ